MIDEHDGVPSPVLTTNVPSTPLTDHEEKPPRLAEQIATATQLLGELLAEAKQLAARLPDHAYVTWLIDSRNADVRRGDELLKKLEQLAGPHCGTCGLAIDPDRCWCGKTPHEHSNANHPLVHEGCDCHQEERDWKGAAGSLRELLWQARRDLATMTAEREADHREAAETIQALQNAPRDLPREPPRGDPEVRRASTTKEPTKKPTKRRRRTTSRK